jgi:hypothetical protein
VHSKPEPSACVPSLCAGEGGNWHGRRQASTAPDGGEMSDCGPLRSSQAARPPHRRDRQRPRRQRTDWPPWVHADARDWGRGHWERYRTVVSAAPSLDERAVRHCIFLFPPSGDRKMRHGVGGEIRTLRSEQQRAAPERGWPGHPGRRSMQPPQPAGSHVMTRRGVRPIS